MVINPKFALPFTLLFAHQHISNSLLGLSNPFIGISFFLLFFCSLFLFLTLNREVGISKYFAILFVIIFIALWGLIPNYFKDISFLYLNLFVCYYIVVQHGYLSIKKQLVYLVGISLLLSVIQISGTSSLVHILNSQFLSDEIGGYIQRIELTNLFTRNINDGFEFDSRQVRPPGVFHSSALISGIFVLYITYIFLGVFKSNSHFIIVPFLCIYSGSKLVLSVTLIFILLGSLFSRISFKSLIMLLFGFLISFISHNFLFKYLFDFQFNTDILLYSLDIRFLQYSLDNLDMDYIFNYLIKFIILVSILLFASFALKFIPSKFQFYNILILFIALFASFFSTPHIANFLWGWFFFPTFFYLKHLKPFYIKKAI
jgi:hypothetical protein